MLFRFEPRFASSSLKSPFAHGLAERPREVRPRVDLLPLDLEARRRRTACRGSSCSCRRSDRAADVAARILVLALRLRRTGQAVRSIVGRKLAGRASNRRAVPWNAELPALVTPLTFMPPVPYSAAKFELCTFTS